MKLDLTQNIAHFISNKTDGITVIVLSDKKHETSATNDKLTAIELILKDIKNENSTQRT